MTSVGTQTHWSWLRDVQEISRLTRERGAELSLEKSEIQSLLEEECSLNLRARERGETHLEESTTSNDMTKMNYVGDPSTQTLESDNKLTDLKSRDSTKQASNARETGMKIPNKSENEGAVDSWKASNLPSIGGAINGKSAECKDHDIKHVEELFLPPIAPAEKSHGVKSDENVNDSKEGDEIITEESRDVSISSLEQLEQLTFPFFEKQTKQQGDEVEGESNTDSESEEEERSNTIPAPHFKLDNFPWPVILQYIRESESLASEYFSLHNKEAVESRIAHNKRLKLSISEDGLHTQSRHLNNTSQGVVCDTESETNDTENQEEYETCKICDFCGQTSPEISLLKLAESKETLKALCCEGRKEFCVLIAACMKQMVMQLQQQKPKKISVDVTKKSIEKTAEEKALSLMYRQRKWEELRRKKEEIQQQTKLPKQTQIIQFSLLSPGIMEGEWMVRPESSSKHQTPKQRLAALNQKKSLKKKAEERLRKGVLLPKTIERLKQHDRPPSELKMLKYGDGEKFAVLLPDGTGQIYYQSGNLVIAAFSPYTGVLAYLVYEDCSQPCLLAYADQLGRITCYDSHGNIKLLLRPCEGFLFDGEGCRSCRKHWRWSKGEIPDLQPFTLSLNKQLTVKLISNEKFLLTFTGSKQNHIRFDIGSKLNNDTILSRDDDDQFTQSHLLLVKTRISHLLQVLKRPNVIARKRSMTDGTTSISDWQSIYGTKMAVQRGAKSVTHMSGGRYLAERRRTKSTGGMNIIQQKSAIKLKPLT